MEILKAIHEFILVAGGNMTSLILGAAALIIGLVLLFGKNQKSAVFVLLFAAFQLFIFFWIQYPIISQRIERNKKSATIESKEKNTSKIETVLILEEIQNKIA